jgi:hypothetical protein
MSQPSQTTISSHIRAALQALQVLAVPFRGPFITPRGNHIYIVGGCILTAPEIVTLHESGRFSHASIRGLLGHLKSQQTPGARRRRSQRVMLRLHLLVRQEIAEGSRPQTHAFTVEVNAHGGLLESPFRMAVGQRITLVNPQTAKEVPCFVVSVQQSSEGYFTTAFEFEQPSPHFWAIASPPLDWSPAEGR